MSTMIIRIEIDISMLQMNVCMMMVPNTRYIADKRSIIHHKE